MAPASPFVPLGKIVPSKRKSFSDGSALLGAAGFLEQTPGAQTPEGLQSASILSLILCTYGRTTDLERLFQSLSMQTFKRFEVIVVDQNPDDRILPYLKQAISDGLKIKHVKLSTPNLSAARNLGIRIAVGEWVGFPDDDCWYEHDLLEQLSACFECTDALTGAAARWDEFDEPAELPLRITWDRSRLFRDRMMVSFMLFFNRKIFDHIGDFDARLGVGQWFGAGEETDLVLRALRAGAEINFYPSARVHHPVKGFGSMTEARRRARGAGALYVKHDLPLWVVMRGLIAPVVRPLFGSAGPKNALVGCMDTLGRWEGILRWKEVESTSSLQAHAKSKMQISPLHAATQIESDAQISE